MVLLQPLTAVLTILSLSFFRRILKSDEKTMIKFLNNPKIACQKYLASDFVIVSKKFGRIKLSSVRKYRWPRKVIYISF